MEIEHKNSKPLTPDEAQHLEHLKAVVENALSDGLLQEEEMTRIKSIIWADGKVTYEELRTVHETIRSFVGDDMVLPLDWHRN